MTDDRNETLARYWRPDPALVQTVRKSGVNLAYVSHVHTQRILDEIDPAWTMRPVCDERGVPVVESHPYRVMRKDGSVAAEGVTLTMWGTMTLLGSERWGVGSAEDGKPEAYKEILGDLLRNLAMRHGVFASLWAKETGGGAATVAAPPPPPDRPADAHQRAGLATKFQEDLGERFAAIAAKQPEVPPLGLDLPTGASDGDRDRLLADVQALADAAHQPLHAFAARWAVVHRKNIDNATPAELEDFLAAKRGAVA